MPLQVDRVLPVAITALKNEGPAMRVIDRRMINPAGRREGDLFDAERCKQQAEYCEKMNQARDKKIDEHNTAIHKKIDTVKNDLTSYISDVKTDLTKSIESVKEDNNRIDRKFWAIVLLVFGNLLGFIAGIAYIAIKGLVII